MNFRVLLHDISASDARVTRLAQSIAPLLGVEAEQLVGRATGRPAWLLDLTDRDGAEQVAQAIESRYGFHASVAPSVGRAHSDAQAVVQAVQGADEPVDHFPAPELAAAPDPVPPPEHPRGWPVCTGPIPGHEAPRLPWPPAPRAQPSPDPAQALATSSPPADDDPFEMTSADSAADTLVGAAVVPAHADPSTASFEGSAWEVGAELAPATQAQPAAPAEPERPESDEMPELDWDRSRPGPTEIMPPVEHVVPGAAIGPPAPGPWVTLHADRGALLDASGERLRVLLRFVEGTEMDIVVAPVDGDGRALAVAVPVSGPPVGAIVLAVVATVGVVALGLRFAGVGADAEPSRVSEPAPAAVAKPAMAASTPLDAGPPRALDADVLPSTHLPDAGASAIGRAVTERARGASVVVRVPGVGVGSGFVVTREGHVLTQLSLLGEATSANVSFADGTMLRAERVGAQLDHDLAVLRLEGADARTPVSFGEATRLKKGDRVFVVGSAIGGDFRINEGRVARALTWLGARPGFRVDALTGPRHSGGAVFDERGAVVGVLTDRSGHADPGYALHAELAYQGDAVLSRVLGRHPRSAAFSGLKRPVRP